jgi:hypothetical protein
MDILIENLHTAARRYCTDKYVYWQQQYAALPNHGRAADGNHYSDEDFNIIPRYNLLKDILIEIERWTPQDFSSLAEARELISLAGSNPANILPKGTLSPIKTKAIEEEKTKFIDFINSISSDDLLRIEPLFFRRVISEKESRLFWAKLVEIWGIDKPHGQMYPMINDNPRNAVFCTPADFKKEEETELLRKLSERGIKRIWELKEAGVPEYESDISVFEPYYDGWEGYWFSAEMDWIIYCSHESTITFGGWITDVVRKALKNQDRNR